MTENSALTPEIPASRTRQDAAKVALSVAGLLMAFGVASCCALPLALSLLGVSAAMLASVAYLAAPFKRELLLGAVACVAGAGFIIWRQRRALACAPGAACERPAVDWTSRITLAVAAVLLALAFWFEPPI